MSIIENHQMRMNINFAGSPIEIPLRDAAIKKTEYTHENT